MNDELKKNNILKSLHWYHWLVLILSLILTLSAWYISRSQSLAKQEAQFNYQADLTISLVKDRLEVYEAALWSGVSAFHSHDLQMSLEEWRKFSTSLSIEQRLPGINGIGFIQYIQDAQSIPELESYHQLKRPNFKVYPEHNQKDAWPIVYIEPEEQNYKAIGLDMAHENNRYTAAKKARDSGAAQITGPITLVQDAKKTPGFLFFAPLYKSQLPKSKLNDKRGNFFRTGLRSIHRQQINARYFR